MAKRTAPAEQSETDAKVVIYCRIDPVTVAGMDEIAKSMKPSPSRAQLIDLACAEYVERHGQSAKRTRS